MRTVCCPLLMVFDTASPVLQVKTNFRTAITIPEKSWSRFRDIFADYVDKMKDGGEKGPSESNK